MEVGPVIRKAAIGLAQPVGDGSVIGAPQHVSSTIPVEIAGCRHVPIGSRFDGERGTVAYKASVRLTKPIGDRPIFGPPQDVVAAVPVEVTCANNVPVRRGRDGEIGPIVEEGAVALAEPFGDYPSVASPQDVSSTVSVEIARTDDLPIGRSDSYELEVAPIEGEDIPIVVSQQDLAPTAAA